MRGRRMRVLLLGLFLAAAVPVAADSFSSSPRDMFSTSPANPYPDVRLVRCPGCPVRLEFYTDRFTPEVLESVRALSGHPRVAGNRHIEVEYYVSLSSQGVRLQGVSRGARWPDGVVFRPDVGSARARERRIEIFPTILVVTSQQSARIIPNDLDKALHQLLD